MDAFVFASCFTLCRDSIFRTVDMSEKGKVPTDIHYYCLRSSCSKGHGVYGVEKDYGLKAFNLIALSFGFLSMPVSSPFETKSWSFKSTTLWLVLNRYIHIVPRHNHTFEFDCHRTKKP